MIFFSILKNSSYCLGRRSCRNLYVGSPDGAYNDLHDAGLRRDVNTIRHRGITYECPTWWTIRLWRVRVTANKFFVVKIVPLLLLRISASAWIRAFGTPRGRWWSADLATFSISSPPISWPFSAICACRRCGRPNSEQILSLHLTKFFFLSLSTEWCCWTFRWTD